MRIIALINDPDVIKRILRHLGLWEDGPEAVQRPPPPIVEEIVSEPFYDDMPYGDVYAEAAPF